MYLAPGGHLMAADLLQRAWQAFAELGPEFEAEADAVAVKVRTVQPLAASEMKRIEGRCEVPPDAIEAINALRELPVDDAVRAVFRDSRFLPNVARLREQASLSPILDCLSQTVLDGRNVASRSEPGGADDEPKLFQLMDLEWQVRSQLLAAAVAAALDGKGAAVNSFAALLDRPFLTHASAPLIRDGLERYLSRDYVGAMHILVPQFEASVRNALMLLDIPVCRQSRCEKGVSEERPLDDMLRDRRFRTVIGDDLWYAYRFLFADRRGLNLRNYLAHGLLPVEAFCRPLASLVVYALLSLGWFDSPAQEPEGQPGVG